MLRSLFTGVLGLNAHQKNLDVVSDNIANVNTPGFKAGRSVFSDMLAQVVRVGGAPSGEGSGRAPLQFGLGVNVAATESDQAQGGLMITNKPTDLAIDGDGFFVLADEKGKVYTRAGAFRWSADDYLVDAAGRRVLGWEARDGILGSDRSEASLKPVSYRDAFSIAAAQTTEAVFAKNLNATDNGVYAAQGGNVLNVEMPSGTVPVTVTMEPTGGFDRWRWAMSAGNADLSVQSGYIEFDQDGTIRRVTDADGNDITGVTVTANGESAAITFGGDKQSLVFESGSNSIAYSYKPYTHNVQFNAYGPKGELYSVSVVFEKTSNNNWHWSAKVTDPMGDSVPCSSSGEVGFGLSGNVISIVGDSISFQTADGAGINIKMDFSRLTQYAGESTAVVADSDGNAPGELVTVNIDDKGTVTGVYSNGLTKVIARIALAKFSAPNGLLRLGDNCYKDGPASGAPTFNEAKVGGAGSIVSGALEMSNVDLAREFTKMIIAQRGFLANARIITVSDEVLQELANLKR